MRKQKMVLLYSAFISFIMSAINIYEFLYLVFYKEKEITLGIILGDIYKELESLNGATL